MPRASVRPLEKNVDRKSWKVALNRRCGRLRSPHNGSRPAVRSWRYSAENGGGRNGALSTSSAAHQLFSLENQWPGSIDGEKKRKWSASWSALAENVVSETCKGNWAGRYSQQLRSHLASEPSNQKGLTPQKVGLFRSPRVVVLE